VDGIQCGRWRQLILDDFIARLEALRAEHGGRVPVWMGDSEADESPLEGIEYLPERATTNWHGDKMNLPARILLSASYTIPGELIEPVAPPVPPHRTFYIPSEKYPTIKAALDEAQNGDEIKVRGGTYDLKPGEIDDSELGPFGE